MNIFHKQLRQGTDCFLPFEVVDPLSEFKKGYKNCQGCKLSEGRKDIVFGYGSIRPRVMFIGMYPSIYDAEVGIPFSDKPGKKLQGLVEYLSRTVPLDNNVYYTNMVLCPGVPTEEEVASCRERVTEEIGIVQPQSIILLGEEVNQALCSGAASRLTKKAIKLDKYYPVFMTYNLRELLFKRDEIKLEVKEDLDYIAGQIGNGDTNGSKVISG